MVIGNGLIASSFNNYDTSDCIIFASGVSNSNDNNADNFKREKDLIIKVLSENNGLKFIYFSSVLAGITNNGYYNHKIDMENLIKSTSDNYLIFRVPQLIGFNGNKNNLINYLTTSIKNKETITIFDDITRALVNIDDMVKIVMYCKVSCKNEILYLSHIEKLSVREIFDKVSDKLNINTNTVSPINNSVDNWDIHNSPIIDLAIDNCGIDRFDYINNIITKYIK